MNNLEKDYILFYKNAKRWYFKYKGNRIEVDDWTINHLKLELTLPYKIRFVGYTKNEICKIVSDLCEPGVDINASRIKNKKYNRALDYMITFSRKKNVVKAIKIPYSCNLYGRSNDINPYTVVDLNGQKALMEVTKDYAKENNGFYYFLASDLTDEEIKFFSDCFVDLEYDYLYKIAKEEKHISRSKIFKNPIENKKF